MALDQANGNELEDGGKEMGFLDHLEALRWHLFRMAIAIAAGAAIVFGFQDWVFANIVMAPKDPNFITFRYLCQLGDTFCYRPTPFNLTTRELGEQFSQSMYVCIWLGVMLSSPYILYEIWKFISPGLYPKERKAIGGIVFACTLLFVTGVTFGYFILAPFGIAFLASYSVGAINTPTLTSYVDYLTMLTLPIGLVFELPIVIFFLTKMGIITPNFLKNYRRHAVVIIALIAGVITPPDVLSQVIVMVPLFILYELSIGVSKREYLRKQKAMEES